MAQIAAGNISPSGINIEEPSTLNMRLSSPMSYTAEIAKSCGLDSAKDTQAILSKLVKLTIPNGVAIVVDMKVISTSPKVSIICGYVVFDLIKTT
jgi:hypothetical protein